MAVTQGYPARGSGREVRPRPATTQGTATTPWTGNAVCTKLAQESRLPGLGLVSQVKETRACPVATACQRSDLTPTLALLTSAEMGALPGDVTT